MADIIRLHSDRHEQIERLLPWYVTGQISIADRAKVEAHLTDCTRCQAELEFERRLSGAVKELPLDVAAGWASLVLRLDGKPRSRPRRRDWLRGAARRAVARPGKIGWMLAAQAAVVVAAVVVSLPADPPASYHTLGSTPDPARAGNLIVIFRPDATERDLRHTLAVTGARLSDGPTAAGAYVLRVPKAEREAALARLRRQPDVVLAQPIDPGAR
jgi:hypothetical protein